MSPENQENTSDEAPKKPKPQLVVPPLLEVTFSVSQTVIVLTLLVVVGLSYFSGAGLWLITFRGAVAILAVGPLMWILDWFVTNQHFEALRNRNKPANEQHAQSRVHKEA